MFLRHRISGLHRKGRSTWHLYACLLQNANRTSSSCQAFGSSKRRGRQPKPGAVSDATQEPVDPNGLPAPTSYDEGMQSAGNESASDDERSDEDMEEEEEIEHPKIFLKIRLKPRPEQGLFSSITLSASHSNPSSHSCRFLFCNPSGLYPLSSFRLSTSTRTVGADSSCMRRNRNNRLLNECILDFMISLVQLYKSRY